LTRLFFHQELLLSRLSPPPGAPPLLPSDFTLLLRLSDSSVLLPLDRTVAASNLTSTGGIGVGGSAGREIELVPKNRVGGVGIGLGVGAAGGGRRKKERDEGGASWLPSSLPLPPLTIRSLADLFRTTSAQSSPDQQHNNHRTDSRQQQAAGLAPYQHYNVFRKLPLTLGGRHPRTIAIDGD
jgi:hypothetical protein